MNTEKYDAVVIGAGPGGYACAIRLGQLKKKTLVVEKARVGGLCLNWGCIPTKALTHVLEVAERVKHLKSAGMTVENLRIDPAALCRWKNGVVTKLTKGIEYLFKSNGVAWISGQAELTSSKKVVVKKSTGEKLQVDTEYVVVATGTEASNLPGLAIDRKDIIGTDEALELAEIPQALLVVGAGASGLEMATIYSRLGSKVTVVEIMDQILPGMDREMVTALHQALVKQGIEVILSSTVAQVDKKNRLQVKIASQKDRTTVDREFDRILLTVGRKPLTAGIDGIGIKKNERGFISVDQTLTTSVPGVFAIGDVVGPPLLAHKASRQGIIVAEIIAGHKTAYNNIAMPSCIFTDPPLASVGATEEQLRRQGANIKIGRFPFAASGKAAAMAEHAGLVKIIGDADSGKLLALHILGPEAPSLIGEGVLAIEKAMKVGDIAEAVHPHPTLSEAVMEAAENFFGKAIHIMNKP